MKSRADNNWARGPAWSGRLLVTEEIEGSNPFGPAKEGETPLHAGLNFS